jgi:hypothetical protein
MAIDDHKRLLDAIATARVQRVERIVHLGLKQNRGVPTIINQTKSAADGVYSVKSFTEREQFLATLIWRLGGDRVSQIAHRALGLPNADTIRGTATTIPPITPSRGQPTQVEVRQNIRASIDGIADMLEQNQSAVHAAEKRIRWDLETNGLLGVCHEQEFGT